MRFPWILACVVMLAVGVMFLEPATAFDVSVSDSAAAADPAITDHGGVMVAQFLDQLQDALNPDRRTEREPRPENDQRDYGSDQRDYGSDRQGQSDEPRDYGYDRIQCGPGEILYKGGCVAEPAGSGEPLYSGGCPEGYFEYEGRCHPRPREEDIRREPREREQAQPDQQQQERQQQERQQDRQQERQCQMALDNCIQQCGAHQGNRSAYNACVRTCNMGFSTCMGQ